MVIIYMISPFVLPFLHSLILQIFMEFGKEYGNAYEEYDNAYEDVGDGYKEYDDDYNGSVYDSGDVSEDGEQGTSSDIMQDESANGDMPVDESLENMSVEDDSNIHVTTPTGDRIVFTLNEDGTYSSQAQTENGTELAYQDENGYATAPGVMSKEDIRFSAQWYKEQELGMRAEQAEEEARQKAEQERLAAEYEDGQRLAEVRDLTNVSMRPTNTHQYQHNPDAYVGSGKGEDARLIGNLAKQVKDGKIDNATYKQIVTEKYGSEEAAKRIVARFQNLP